nr:transketolase C-terminal domain-containing protein [Jiangella asiatica]
MREVWGRTLTEVGQTDPRVVLLDGDLANSTKADIFAEGLPDRFLQLGIAEQNLVGTAAGLSTMGYVPWLSSFTVFFTHRALDPIRMLVAQTGANVKIAAAYSGLLTGLTGKTHQDVQDLAIMRAMPGMVVLAPGDAAECAAMVRWATDHDGPVYLRLARDPAPELGMVPADDYTDGAVHVVRPGRRVVLVSTGVQTVRVLEAADLLAASGVDAGVVHVPCLKPLDDRRLLDAVGAASLVVTVEEHTVLGGLGGLVAEVLGEHGTGARVHRVGLRDVWGESAPNDFLLDRYGLSGPRVAEAVRAALA